jgi:hypothetical protein
MNTVAYHHIQPRLVPDGVEWPAEDTLVLLHREWLPGTDPAQLSRFGADRWSLNEAIFEQHMKSVVLNFSTVPEPLRLTTKYYVWQLINADAPGRVRTAERPALGTIQSGFSGLKKFLWWLHRQQVTEFSQITHELLDDYLRDVVDTDDLALDRKYRLIVEVRRLWCYRDSLPGPMRLPVLPPWGGDPARELFQRTRPKRDNLTPRITEATMQTLLAWALRFVEEFSADIIPAFHEYRFLHHRNPTRRYRHGETTYPRRGDIEQRMAAYLDRLRRTGGSLPGRADEDGTVRVDWNHVAKILACSPFGDDDARPAARMLLESGIPVADSIYLQTPITATYDGIAWHDGPIAYAEALSLARLLTTASLIIISYLSGARVGEVLNLRRGCIEHDTTADLWLMNGIYFKNAVDEQGRKVPAGKPRQDPWVVVEPVARAVAVLEELHDQPLLFSRSLDPRRRTQASHRTGRARNAQSAANDLTAFVAWVDDYCRHRGMPGVPADPQGPLAISRFRRTLAWFLRRRPRGLVAGAIQYAQVEARIFQGYAGAYESGFPDEYAFEDFLARLEELAEDQQQLDAGEHVSGPAADAYRSRVSAAHKQFAGHVLTSNRQARDLLGNPLLQIFHGQGMTCVLDPAKAACQMRGTAEDPMVTPDVTDCRPRCPNIARTDRDIVQIHQRRDELAEIVADPLAPPIRHQREQHELDRLTTILENHT